MGCLKMFKAPHEYLTEHPLLGIGDGNNGFFTFKKNNITYYCIASDGEGWEHVSVSLSVKRTPNWEEMCMIKDLFWDEEDVVIQIHPKKSEYVNNHNYCLHLWRPVNENIKTPHNELVGIK